MKTPWFPGDILPVRKGVYERRINKRLPLPRGHWNGRVWFVGRKISYFQRAEWRGLLR